LDLTLVIVFKKLIEESGVLMLCMLAMLTFMRVFMRSNIAFGLLGMCLLGNLFAEFEQPIVNYEIASGYRHDNFRWQMRGINQIPNELWKMNWKTIRMAEITGTFSWVTCSNYYVRITADWATTYQGQVRSSGYRQNDEKDEYSRIKGDADSGHATDFAGGLGYQFTSNGRRVIATPIIGWAYHSQKFSMSHAEQEINKPLHHHHRHHHHRHHRHHHDHGRLGKIPNLNASYNPHWHGPWIGVDVAAEVDVPCTILFGSLEYHWSQQYRARGRWRLGDDFLNTFRHHTNGRGVVGRLGLNVRVCGNWWFGVLANYRNFGASKGKHRSNTIYKWPRNSKNKVFGRFPIIPKTKHTRLHAIRWNSWSVSACVDYRY
jgi:Protochlamydia outer membrane protein